MRIVFIEDLSGGTFQLFCFNALLVVQGFQA